MHEIFEQIMGHVVSIWQRRWIVLIVAWILSIAAWTYIFYIPDRFQASARVYVDTQSPLKPLLAGLTVQPNTDEEIGIMASTIINRPNLEKVARMTDLDLSAKNPTEQEKLINSLETGITLLGSGSKNIYTINYQNKNPVVAKKVVQALLTIFVDNGLGSNRKDISSSQKFIEGQLKDYEIKLIAAESALKDFKRLNIGYLPGEEGKNYYTELSTIHDQISQAEMALIEAKNKRDSFKRQLSGDDPTVLSDTSISTTPEVDARIENFKKNLDKLRLTYTEDYPDIVATKRVITSLEASKKKDALQHKPSAGLSQNTYYQNLNLAQADAAADVASLQARLDGYQSQYAQLKAAANKIPEVEEQYTALTRNYDTYKKNYDVLLARLESAKLSGELDAKTDIVDFKIIDPPRVPLTPAFPNRPLLMSLALLASMAVGIAVAFLFNQIKPIIRNKHDIALLTDLPVLGNIGLIKSQTQRLKNRKGLFAFSSASLALMGAFGVLMVWQLIVTKTV